MHGLRAGALTLVLVAGLACAREAEKAAPDASAAVQGFVQGFYDWYMSKGPGREPLLERRRIREALAPDLLQALRADRAAQDSAQGELVGIDYDPFLAAQDPCDRYRVTSVVRSGEHFRAAILGSGGCEAHTRPDVVAEVAPSNGGWVIVNFRYPGPPEWDLLANLRRLRQDREQATPAPAAAPTSPADTSR